MLDVILAGHVYVGTAVPVLGAVLLLKGLYGWFTRDFFTYTDQALGSIFVGLVDLNLLLGIVLLVSGMVPGGIHLFIMLGLVFAAHGSRVLGRRKDAGERHLHQAMEALSVSLVVLIFGVFYY